MLSSSIGNGPFAWYLVTSFGMYKLTIFPSSFVYMASENNYNVSYSEWPYLTSLPLCFP